MLGAWLAVWRWQLLPVRPPAASGGADHAGSASPNLHSSSRPHPAVCPLAGELGDVPEGMEDWEELEEEDVGPQLSAGGVEWGERALAVVQRLLEGGAEPELAGIQLFSFRAIPAAKRLDIRLDKLTGAGRVGKVPAPSLKVLRGPAPPMLCPSNAAPPTRSRMPSLHRLVGLLHRLMHRVPLRSRGLLQTGMARPPSTTWPPSPASSTPRLRRRWARQRRGTSRWRSPRRWVRSPQAAARATAGVCRLGARGSIPRPASPCDCRGRSGRCACPASCSALRSCR